MVSVSTAEAIVERAAAVTSAGMPLPAGLRAAAEEADTVRLASALRNVAAELERGCSLDEILSASTHHLPPHLAGLIRAAQRTGGFGPLLAAWMENRRAAWQHWRTVMAALAYPLITSSLAIAVFML